MTNTPFPAVHSFLATDALLAFVRDAYNIDPLRCQLQLLNHGVNDTYLIKTQDQQYILRVYRSGWRNSDEVAYELEALRHLQARAFDVSWPVARRDGRYVDQIQAAEGVRFVALFTFAPGKGKSHDAEIARQFGTSVARMHASMDGFASPHARFRIDLHHLLTAPLETVGPFLAHRPEDRAFIETLAARLRETVRTLPIDTLDLGFCHGDLHGANVHFTDDLRATHFDFDCCGQGWRAYDVAVYRWSTRLREKEAVLWPPFLEGYQSQRTLSDQDIQAAQWFIPIRHIWLLGLHTGMAPVHGHGWLNDDYWDRQLKFLHACEAEYYGVNDKTGNPVDPASKG